MSAGVWAFAVIGWAEEGEGLATGQEGQERMSPVVVGREEAVAWALAGNRGLTVEGLDVERNEVAAERAWEGIGGWEVSPVGSLEGGDGTRLQEAGVEGQWTGDWGTRVSGSVRAREWHFDEPGVAPSRRGEIRVGVEQPLLKGFGKLVREEGAVEADEAWRAARRGWERKRSALAVQVASCWEGARYLEREIAADRAQAGRLERLCAQADAKERRGEAARTEVLRLEWQLGEARQRVENEMAELGVRLRELGDLMGVEGNREVRLAECPLLEVEAPEEGKAVEVAWKERPEVAQAEEDVAAARRGVKVARRGLLPEVSVGAEQAWWGEGEEWSDATGGGKEELRVGVAGRMPLRMAEARLDVKSREIAVAAAEGRLEMVRDEVALDVRTALAEWRRAQGALALALSCSRAVKQRIRKKDSSLSIK